MSRLSERRRSGLLSRMWRSVAFVMTLRAIAKPYRSRRLYTVESDVEGLGMASPVKSVQ